MKRLLIYLGIEMMTNGCTFKAHAGREGVPGQQQKEAAGGPQINEEGNKYDQETIPNEFDNIKPRERK